MIKEVKEVKIPYIIPELRKTQPIGKKTQLPTATERHQNRSYGIPKNNDLTVKGSPMTEEQRANANAVLDTGVSLLIPLNDAIVRKCLVLSMMCVIQESTLHNLLPAHNPGTAFNQDSVGLFQQRPSQGWPGSRDIPRDATAFFNALRPAVMNNPNSQYYALIQEVQRSGYPTAYAQWRTEAERIVTAYGFVDGSVADLNAQFHVDTGGNGDYEFYRGIRPTTKKTQWGRESSWDCIQRLANEVNWRAFFVSGYFYWVSDADLLKSQPIAIIDEDSTGILSIDGSYSEGTKSASVTVTCFASRWAAPPGSVVQLKNMGPWNGRWLVNDIKRSLFDPQATITLKKREPRLPEPVGTNVTSAGSTFTGTPPSLDPSQTTGPTAGAPVGDAGTLAAALLLKLGNGWHDDNGRGAAQMRKVAAGIQLDGAAGPVFMDPGPIRVVLWLINQGYTIGTYAWCEDHSNDGLAGHTGGKAVDISSINGNAINQLTDKVHQLVLEVDKLLHGATGELAPRQLITGGYGNRRDLEISNYSIPSADTFYGYETMQEHTNHIHVGY